MVLSLLCYVLARWRAVAILGAPRTTVLPDWGELAGELLRLLLPDVVWLKLYREMLRLEHTLSASSYRKYGGV
jgi:hypothetical protein